MHVWSTGTKCSPKARTATRHANPRTCPRLRKHTLSVPKGSVGGGLAGASSRTFCSSEMECNLRVKMMVQISPTANTRYVVPRDRSTTKSFRLNPLSAYALQFGGSATVEGKIYPGDAPDTDNDLSDERRNHERQGFNDCEFPTTGRC